LSSFVEEKLRNNFNEEIPESLKADIVNELKLFYDSNQSGLLIHLQILRMNMKRI